MPGVPRPVRGDAADVSDARAGAPCALGGMPGEPTRAAQNAEVSATLARWPLGFE